MLQEDLFVKAEQPVVQVSHAQDNLQGAEVVTTGLPKVTVDVDLPTPVLDGAHTEEGFLAKGHHEVSKPSDATAPRSFDLGNKEAAVQDVQDSSDGQPANQQHKGLHKVSKTSLPKLQYSFFLGSGR